MSKSTENTFDPWGDKMPWDDEVETESASGGDASNDNGDTSNGDAVPINDDVDGVESEIQENVKSSKVDVFAALEEKLNIPIGSTSEALHPHKQITERIKADASKLVLQDKMLSVQLNAGKLNADTFCQARAKVMHDALRMVDIANNFIDKMQDQLDMTVDVTDKMWASVASMITSVTTAIEKLDKITKNIRQEEELHQIELQKAEDAKKSLNDDGTMELLPSQTNEFICKIVEEEEKRRNIELGVIPSEDSNETN